MTDRCSTEQKVNNLLTSEIKKTIPQDHDYVTEKCQNEPNSFKCAVDPLLQFSEVCLKEVRKVEIDQEIEIDGVSKTESNVHFLLRCVSKLFYKDGTGDPLLSSIFILQCSDTIKKIPIMNFRGNRFKLLFHNSAGTYVLQKHLVQYLTSSKSSLNYIQSFIVRALQNCIILSLLRALGIMSKLFTEPYWNFVQSNCSSAIEMGTIYHRVIQFLEEGAENPSLLLRNEIRLFEGPVKDDPMYACLFEDSIDKDTLLFISTFCVALKDKCSFLFKEFFEGGKFYNPGELMLESAKSCPPDNINVERLMAKLDQKVKKEPTSNTSSIESTIIYRSNKTSNWLDCKGEEEKSEIIRKAMSSNCKHMKKLRKASLKQDHLHTITLKQQSVKAKIEKRKEKIEAARKHVKECGLWSTEDEINNSIESLKTKKEKVAAVKSQINLYKTVKNVEPQDRHLLYFSKKGKPLTCETLIQNLLQLIQKYLTPASNKPYHGPEDIVRKCFEHVWTDNGVDEKWLGRVVSYVFHVKYWRDNCDEFEGEDEYELTTEELLTDFNDGFLIFKDPMTECRI